MSDSEELGFVFIGHRTTRDLYEKHGEQTRIGLDDESSLDSSTILDILRRKKGRRIASRGLTGSTKGALRGTTDL